MGDYDADTTGDFNEYTLDGSEGLDADHFTADGENYVMDPPDHWRGADPHSSLNQRLAEEKPDVVGTEDQTDEYQRRYGRWAALDTEDDAAFTAEVGRQYVSDRTRNRKLGYAPN